MPSAYSSRVAPVSAPARSAPAGAFPADEEFKRVLKMAGALLAFGAVMVLGVWASLILQKV